MVASKRCRPRRADLVGYFSPNERCNYGACVEVFSRPRFGVFAFGPQSEKLSQVQLYVDPGVLSNAFHHTIASEDAVVWYATELCAPFRAGFDMENFANMELDLWPSSPWPYLRGCESARGLRIAPSTGNLRLAMIRPWGCSCCVPFYNQCCSADSS